jgi:hypothetical protein
MEKKASSAPVLHVLKRQMNGKKKYEYGATLTLLRTGIAEELRIFEMPCRWTFNM